MCLKALMITKYNIIGDWCQLITITFLFLIVLKYGLFFVKL